MDASLLEQMINKNQPFRIETASGKSFDVPHRDFINFSAKRSAAFIFFEEEGKDSFAIVPLLTVTAVVAQGTGFSATQRD